MRKLGSTTGTALAAIALAALALSGCDGGDSPLDLEAYTFVNGVIFVTMPREATFHMDALFQGDVVPDTAGCLRLEAPAPDASTVVWPKGFRLEAKGSAMRVVDGLGGVVGRIGEAFRMGGGHVPSLHEGLGFTADQRSLLESRCPGSFWIVGEIPVG